MQKEPKDYSTFIYGNESSRYTSPKQEKKVVNQHQNVNVVLQQSVTKQHIIGVRKQQNDVEGHVEDVKHHEDSAKQLENELERQNELEIIFQDEHVEEYRNKELVLEKYVRRHYALEKIIGNEESEVMTRERIRSEICLHCYFKPKSIKDSLENKDCIQDTNEEIEKIEKNTIWTQVPRHKDKNFIAIKWVFRNKINEKGEVTRNKDRLVCKGYEQE